MEARASPHYAADMADTEAKPVGPIHPGVILHEEFLEPLKLSAYSLASVPRTRITRSVRENTALMIRF
jgi:plasmid maintenance system antidote protein VapI